MNATQTKKDNEMKKGFYGMTKTEWLALPMDERLEIIRDSQKEKRRAAREAKKDQMASKPRTVRTVDRIRLGDHSEDDCLGY